MTVAPPFEPSPRWKAQQRRAASLMALLAVLGVLLAACGGGSPGASGTTSTTAQSLGGGSSPDPQSQAAALLKFAACMRSNGLPNFPDPINGFLSPPPGVSPTSPQFQSAAQKCQSLMPNGGGTSVTGPQNLAGLAKAAACMTKKGFLMSATSTGSLNFSSSVDPNSPQFQAAMKECQKLVPDGLP
jgi:hypothetical protein